MEKCDLENLKGKNWMAAMSLCWFLGAFGAHRFYTGKNNSAWVMVVFTATGILAPFSALWMLLDGIVLALGQFTHADGSELFEYKPWFGYLFLAIVVLSVVVAILFFVFFAAVIFAGMNSVVPPVAS